MTNPSDLFDDLVITFKPEATPEEEDRFTTELARAILAIARHLVEAEDVSAERDEMETMEL